MPAMNSDLIKPNLIKLDVSNGVGLITLDRPERMNAVTREMSLEIDQVMEAWRDDDNVRVVMLTGAGDRAFCAGADIENLNTRALEGPTRSGMDMVRDRGRVSRIFYEYPKPSVGAINGVVAGVGIGYSLGCDLRIASENARFVPAFVRLGLTPDGGTTFLMPRTAGVSRAFQVLCSNKPVGAEEALEMGLVNRVVPAEGFIGAAMEFATVIAQGPPIALELTRKAVFRGLDTDLLSALELESLAQAVCLSTEDHQEGLNAFREKRAPRFAGR